MIQSFNFIANVGRILLNWSNTDCDIKDIFDNHFWGWANHFNSDRTGFIHNEVCPDIYAGTIRNGNVCKKMFIPDERKKMPQRTKTEGKKFFNTVVIVLESPHKDEYADSNFINPALGTTGTNLNLYFQSLVDVVVNQFNSKLKRGTHKIILMESIQYQCSLGIKTKECRDLIFTEIWKNDCIKKDFADRLSSYNPDVIFNCCTKGNSKFSKKSELRKLVQEEIENYSKTNPNIELYKCSHPSGWSFDISKA